MEKSKFIAPLHDYVLLQAFQKRIKKVLERRCNRIEMKRLVGNHERRPFCPGSSVCYSTYPCLSWKLMHAHIHICLPKNPPRSPVTQALSKHGLSSLELFTRLQSTVNLYVWKHWVNYFGHMIPVLTHIQAS